MAKEPGAAGGNPPAGPAAGEAGAAGKPEAYRYRCREACTFMKRYWGEGEVAVLPAKTDNRHFELVG